MKIIFLKNHRNKHKGDIVSSGGVMAAALIEAKIAKEYHEVIEASAEKIKEADASSKEKEKLDAEKVMDAKQAEKEAKKKEKEKAQEVLDKAAEKAKKAKIPSQMNKAELTELAKEMDVKINDDMTNKEIIAAIKAK